MVTITRPNLFSIQMPTPDEMAGLLAISRASLFPKAPPLSDSDGRVFFTSFAVAFSYISTLRRTTELKTRADLWIDRCGAWAQERHGERTDIGLSAFMSAIGAAGDVPYRLDLGRWPHDIFVGLSWTEGPAATAAGWQQVLASKKCRAPVPPPKPLYGQPPHPLIYGQD